MLATVREEPNYADRLDFEKALALLTSKPLYWRKMQHRRRSCTGCNGLSCGCVGLHAARKGANGGLSGGGRFFDGPPVSGI